MRLFSKIFSILLLLSVLYTLSPFSVYALTCPGTCRPYDCAAGEIEVSGTCRYGYICCKTYIPPPQPTYPDASPTGNPPTPTTGGKQCTSSLYCYNSYCIIGSTPTPVPNCSAVCLNGYCYVTNPTPGTDITCNQWGAWGACLSDQNTCSACAAQGYTCQTRFCANPPNSNQYEISCGCPPTDSGGGGTNPTNTPVPTSTPTPTPNPYWLKLKATSFYSPKVLSQSVPANPTSGQDIACRPTPGGSEAPAFATRLPGLSFLHLSPPVV
jgi:hypothetical protein